MDFFDTAQAQVIEGLLDNPDQRYRLATAAALKAHDYSSADGLNRWPQLIEL